MNNTEIIYISTTFIIVIVILTILYIRRETVPFRSKTIVIQTDETIIKAKYDITLSLINDIHKTFEQLCRMNIEHPEDIIYQLNVAADELRHYTDMQNIKIFKDTHLNTERDLINRKVLNLTKLRISSLSENNDLYEQLDDAIFNVILQLTMISTLIKSPGFISVGKLQLKGVYAVIESISKRKRSLNITPVSCNEIDVINVLDHNDVLPPAFRKLATSMAFINTPHIDGNINESGTQLRAHNDCEVKRIETKVSESCFEESRNGLERRSAKIDSSAPSWDIEGLRDERQKMNLKFNDVNCARSLSTCYDYLDD
jgi:hypothetical protein